MDSEEEQNLRDQEWQQQAHKPGDVVRPTIDQEQFVKEVDYRPDSEDDDNGIGPVEWDHENN
jgi:hypothetical protein